ncbi:MAG: winged helix-turn-helix transcriptional regulator [Nocardioides sp.]|nr:winged helix-turn-helix transcriptional regulator [Nocardioides sp.]
MPQEQPNSIGVTLGLLGDQWNLLLVQQALLGRSRFGEFMEALPISNAVLAARLRTLAEHGVLEQRPYSTSPPRSGYVLTDSGRALWPVLLSIWGWERRWASDPAAAALPAMVHVGGCGEEFAPALTCRACGATVDVADLGAEWGPSGGWPRSVPAASTRRQRGPSPADLGLFPDTLSLIGNRWALALLGACLLGLTRFRELERALQAPPTIVSDRLRTFVARGVLAEADDGSYHLTAKGRAVLPTVLLALAWGERWHPAKEGPALLLTHPDCGAPFEARLCCDRCRKVLTVTEVALGS